MAGEYAFPHHLKPFLDGVGKLKRVEFLAGGMQNTNYKLTLDARSTDVSAKASSPNTRQLVVRIPSDDAAQHGQTHAIVFANSVQAAKCGGHKR